MQDLPTLSNYRKNTFESVEYFISRVAALTERSSSKEFNFGGSLSKNPQLSVH